MTKENLLSDTIAYLRFPLIVGVVLIHFNLANTGIMVHGVTYGLNNPAWFDYFVYYFSEVLGRVSVPLFYLISGFLFFYHVDFNFTVYKGKLQKRIKTLFIPYILWNLIAILILLSYGLPFLSSIFPNAQNREIHLSLTRLFNTFFANVENEGIFVMPQESITDISTAPFPIDVPLWFVRDLMVVTLFTPLIYWLVKGLGKWYVIAVGIIWFFLKPSVDEVGWSVYLCSAVFFFSWGAYYSIGKTSFVDRMRVHWYAPFVYVPVSIADLLTKHCEYNLFIHETGIVLGITSAVTIASYLLERKNIKPNYTLSQSTFFIYALHTLIMGELGKLIFVAFHIPDTPYAMLGLYILVPAITITICVSIYVGLRRYAPSVCYLLSGGR